MIPIKKIINNPSFFNFVIILSFIHIIMFIDKRDYNCVLIFGSLTFIFNFFLNKIEINLLCSIVATNIFFACKKNKEGFDIGKLAQQLENIQQKSSKKDVGPEEEDEVEEEDGEVEEEDGQEVVKKKHKIVKKNHKMDKKNKIVKKKDKGYKKEITNQKKNIEGLLGKFAELKNNKDAVINPQALSVFMNMNKSISNATDESEFYNLKNLLKNNKEAVKNLIDAF